MFLSANDGALIASSILIIFFIDAVIVVMGWINRNKFDFIPPKFFGIMSGAFTEYVVKKFGLGLIANCLFMIPVYIISVSWLVIMAKIIPSMAGIHVGMVIGFHLALLLLSLMKLSIVAVLEAKYGVKKFREKVKKAIKAFMG